MPLQEFETEIRWKDEDYYITVAHNGTEVRYIRSMIDEYEQEQVHTLSDEDTESILAIAQDAFDEERGV